MTPRRHDLLRLRPGSWAELRGRRRELSAIGDWAHPVVSRRRIEGDRPDRHPVAIALPPSAGGSRLAFDVSRDQVERVQRPPLLRDALPKSLPQAWRALGERALAVGDRVGITPRVFGSAMWQCVTGSAYLRDGSDLDLIWELGRVDCLADLLEGLRSIGGERPRLDGEIVFAGVGAVNWVEWLTAGERDEVLVKTEMSVTLMTRAGILEAAHNS